MVFPASPSLRTFLSNWLFPLVQFAYQILNTLNMLFGEVADFYEGSIEGGGPMSAILYLIYLIIMPLLLINLMVELLFLFLFLSSLLPSSKEGKLLSGSFFFG